jgi:hypothetical protein
MTTNLLYSLPKELVDNVFGFDPTYHKLFSTKQFKSNLLTDVLNKNFLSYFKKNQGRFEKHILASLSVYFEENDMQYEEESLYGIVWKNEFAYIANDEYPETEVGLRIKLKSLDKISIYFEPTKEGIVYFKILPYNGVEMWKALRPNQKYFDGMFCDRSTVFVRLRLFNPKKPHHSYSKFWNPIYPGKQEPNPFLKMDFLNPETFGIFPKYDRYFNDRYWMGVNYMTY